MPSKVEQVASKVEQVDGVMGLDGKEGVVLASTKGGLSFVAPGDKSYLLLDTKNLAVLKAGDNSVAIYDDTVTGGMIDIQANSMGAVNVAVQNGATQNTALTITDGKAHLGIFNTAKFDRVHVEGGKVALESSVGPVAASKELGMVEVTPTKVTIKCLESTMEVDVNGFSWQNAAKSFKMVLETNKFFVQDLSTQNKFEIDLSKQTVSITGVKLATESLIQTQIKNLENKITVDVATLQASALAALVTKVEGMIKGEAALLNNRITAIENTQAGLNSSNGCWIARAVFGEEDIRWRLFRHWLFGHGFHPDNPTWLQGAYLRHGPWVAEVVRRCPSAEVGPVSLHEPLHPQLAYGAPLGVWQGIYFRPAVLIP
jgi:hypothetical protein